MQPCPVCGGQLVDAAGYCVQCGTFRGTSGPPPAVPISTPPTNAPGPPAAYPGSPAYPPAYPGSSPAYPGSPAAYPGSPAYPPAYYPPASAPPGGQPPRQRSPYLIPLIALSATLVVLVVAIVIVVTARNRTSTTNGQGGPETTTPAQSSSSAASVVDSCVVGSWRVTSHEERVPIDNVGNVTFTGGDGAKIRLAADGTGVTDYGNGTEFEGTANGRTITLILSGDVTYRYHTANGTVSFRALTSRAHGVVKVDGVEVGREDFDATDDPAKYTCTASRLTQATNLYETVMTRES